LIFAYDGTQHIQFAHAPAGTSMTLKPGTRYIFNPGSVGQPRDGDPRAAYALWDTDQGTIRFERVNYDIVTTQRQMREARLPELLAERLEYGR
jgi:diadenosine tetraphosphatase ApaH/serine/threonine PP2A family protein phosphatase